MSLPLTPPVIPRPPSRFDTPPSDESALYELSFDYEQNSAGEWHRVSKGRASPPTPVDKQSPPSTDSNILPDDPSPASSSRQSLTRSESLPGIPSTLPTERPDPVPTALRSLQRALSGPVSLPQSTSQPLHAPAQTSSTYVRSVITPGSLLGAGRTTGDPRRATLDKFNERVKVQQQQQEQDANDLHIQTTQDEKENHDGGLSPELSAGPSSVHRRYSPPLSVPALSGSHLNYLSSRYSSVGTTSSSTRSTLADVIPPQRPSLPMPSSASITRQLMAGPSRISRVQSLVQKKFSRGLAIDKISEVETVDDDTYADQALNSETDGGAEEQPRSQAKLQRQRVNALTHSATRPRRSASLSDASTPERPIAPPLSSASSQSSARPGTSMGLINSRTGATRVALEERKRRDQEIAFEEEYARAQQREEEDLEVERGLSRWASRPYLMITCAPRSAVPTRSYHSW
ncbi:hypothetical protein EDB92DRAFT_1180999 [Lactarius akahatsu]|uniref:Uncharacterized protein n=1 Tax=Lactarius akahatsu TaxID=416441 RepID=A0AAD4LQ65_9AGAM|nr:hypothetical protein EDB92DRAFT_1180999 [Lactarius akahatsu]